jgi:hypothetical protein
MTDAAARWQLDRGHVLFRVRRGALVAGLGAAALSAAGALLDPVQFLRSYLAAYVFWVGVPLGCLALLMLQYLTGGAWGAVIRRPLESGTRTLPLMALLFVPVALGVGELYAWAQPEAVAHDPLLQHKRVYLNVPFFLARAVLYFGVWVAVSHALDRWSRAQDETDDPTPGVRLELLSRGGLLLLGLTMTFASIDWVMSLEAHWFSTIYGVIFMGGAVLSALTVAVALAALLARRPPLAGVITAAHLHDLGKLLLAFVMLWAYFAFSQFLIIWSGNLPEETPWYLARLRGGWQWVALGLVVFHFVLPFLLLLSREVKRRAGTLLLVALGLLAMRFVDVFWLVAPAFRPAALGVHVLDVATAVAVGGVWLATFVGGLAGRPLVPLRDPSLPEVSA